jgi:hypothetical protein
VTVPDTSGVWHRTWRFRTGRRTLTACSTTRPRSTGSRTGPGDRAWVRDAVARVVADADAAFDPRRLWPAHEWDGWDAPLPLKNLYVGAAGVVWALDRLRRLGQAETTLDLRAAALRVLELWREQPDFQVHETEPDPPEAALLSGESGILLVAWRLDGDRALADALLSHVRANVANEAEDVMWGTPGTLLAAAAMRDWTGEERWADAARESADALAARRDGDGLWTQRLWATCFRGVSPLHGLVGNVRALLHVDDPRSDGLRRESAAALARMATHEDGSVNWSRERKLQWCDGAPGIVSTDRDYLDGALLTAAAELIWRAGPHGDEKGHGICHGTSGNGFAFLAAFEREQDERWLERARRFAVHALAQTERLPGRYSLFTGGVGTARFAAACLGGDPRLPVLDVL